MLVVQARQQIELGTFVVDGVITAACADDKAQVERLEAVVLVVVEYVDEHAPPDIVLVGPAAAHGPGGRSIDAGHQRGGR